MIIILFLVASFFGLIFETVGKYLATFVGFDYQLYLPGPQLFGAPILAVLGWGFLITMAMSITSYLWRTAKPSQILYFQESILDALLLTTLDFIFEPSAVQMGWWKYFSGPQLYRVPLMNILAWMIGVFLFSFVARAILRSRRVIIPRSLFGILVTTYTLLLVISLLFAVYYEFQAILAMVLVGSIGAFIYLHFKSKQTL